MQNHKIPVTVNPNTFEKLGQDAEKLGKTRPSYCRDILQAFAKIDSEKFYQALGKLGELSSRSKGM